MKSVSLVACGFVLAALSCTSAFATPLTYSFNFSFGNSSDNFYGSGVLTAQADGTTADGGPQYLVTGITGTSNGQAITGLAPVGTFPTGFLVTSNDNLLSDPASFDSADFGADAYFTTGGLSYELGSGRNLSYVNLSENDDENKGTNKESFFGPYSDITQTADETINISPVSSPVPEPGSLALLGTGVLAAAGAIRRRLMA